MSYKHHSLNNYTKLLKNLHIVICIIIVCSHNLYSQGSANVNVTGIPGVVNTPFTDEFFDNFSNGRYQVIFNYNNPNPAPQEFSFRFTFVHNGKQLLEIESRPQAFDPGMHMFASVFEDLSFDERLDDILDQLDRKLLSQVIQGGTLPEGNYQLKIDPIAHDNPNIAAAPSFVNFVVVYPDAPILINPVNEGVLAQEIPIFSWTSVPVSDFMIEYDFLLVEVMEHQTPLQALRSNRAHAEETLVGTNTLLYTPQYLPLEEGQEYAWRVTARSPDGELPIKNEGESSIRTFTYKKSELLADLDELREITIIPGIAKLTDLENIEVDEEGGTLLLNGISSLVINNNESEKIDVDLNNLIIQKGNLSNPILMGGSLDAIESVNHLSVLSDISHLVDFTDLRWSFEKSAIELSGDILLPDNQRITSETWVSLSTSGLMGKLSATNTSGAIKVGEDPLEIYVEQFEVSFPEKQLHGAGKVELFNGASTCNLSNINLSETNSIAVFDCENETKIELIEGSEQLALSLNNLTGALNYDVSDNSIEYNLDASAKINIGLEDLSACSANLQVNFSNENGFVARQITPVCDIYAPPLDLGFMKLDLNDIDFKSFAYSGSGEWDFDIDLDSELKIPAFDDWTLPSTNVNLNQRGLNFTDLSWNRVELGIDKTLDIGGFGIKPLKFDMPEFTFPLFNWTQDDVDAESLGDWNFNIDFDFNLPQYSNNPYDNEDQRILLPECFVGNEFENLSGAFENGKFSANLPATLLQDCEINLTEEYGLIINELSGVLSAEAGIDALNLESEFNLDADLRTGYPFNCLEDDDTKLSNTNLKIDNYGFLVGNVDGVVTGCGADIGPFNTDILSSELVFENRDNSQSISIQAGAELNIGGNNNIIGSLRYNIITGEFEELDFELEDQMLLKIPSQKDPIFTFLIEALSLTKEGISIDGRQELIIGNHERIAQVFDNTSSNNINWPEDITTIGVTFDDVTLNLDDYNVRSGRIIFDESFAFSAGVDEEISELNYSVTRKKDDDETELADNHLYAELGSTIIIDKDGLHTSGAANADLSVAGLKFGDIAIEFTENFSMGLDPFGVEQGRAELLHDYRRVAYIDDGGFHLDPTYLTQALPDTLGLPDESTAYIVLRDSDGNLLVDAEKQEDGTFKMSTLAPVDLVLPVLQFDEPSAPQVAVDFTDIVYDFSTNEITAGEIVGEFNPGIDLMETGIPLNLTKLRYSDGTVSNDIGITENGLYLEGELILFDHEIGDGENIALLLRDGHRLEGEIVLEDIDTNVPIVPESELAMLGINHLEGIINIDLDKITNGVLEPNRENLSFDLYGQIKLNNSENNIITDLDYYATYVDHNFRLKATDVPENSSKSEAYYNGPVGFALDNINQINLEYSHSNKRFNFNTSIDFEILLAFEDSDTLAVPLSNVELSESGFNIPEQEIHESSNPVLEPAKIALGPTELTLLSFNILEDIRFNWFTGEAIPPAFAMDFDLSLEALDDISPSAAAAPITLQNVGYNKGVLTGEIVDYRFEGKGAPLSLGNQNTFYLTKVEGGLTNTGTIEIPEQGFDINLKGNLENNTLFTGAYETCDTPNISVQLSHQGGLVGTANDIAPCGTLAYGPAEINFDTDSHLEFNFTNNTQSIILNGAVSAEIDQINQPEKIIANGDVSVDVLNGNLIDGSIIIDDIFNYGYPYSEPLFTFRVQQAKLDTTGLVINGDAGLVIPNTEDTAKVEFTNFTVTPNDVITEGSVTIQDSLAFELGISPMYWEVVNPQDEFTADNTARLLLEGGVTINKDGMMLFGSGEANIRAGNELFPSLNVDYTNFNVNFNPLGVSSGRADFIIADEDKTLGYLDEDGFHLDIPGLIASVLPDTLGLPNKETAYLVFGDEAGDRYELIDEDGLQRAQTLPGKTVEMVIPGATDQSGNPLKTQVNFSTLMDNSMNIKSGEIELAEELDLDQYLNIPLVLDSLRYTSDTGKLTAGVHVILPNSLKDAELAATAVIGSNGFESAQIEGSIGEYTEHYTASQENVDPILTDSFGDGAFEYYLRGIELELGNRNSLAISGQIKSTILADEDDEKTPIHFAAEYGSSNWQVILDANHLENGINIGYAVIKPFENEENKLFSVLLNDEEFAFSFNGTVTMPELLGDDFNLDVNQFRVSSKPVDGQYITVDATQNLPNQEFGLINDVLTFKTEQTQISFASNILSLKTDGTFDFYDQTGLEFNDFEFSSDGSMSLGGAGVTNLLPNPIELLPDSAAVLSNLGIELDLDSKSITLLGGGFANIPEPFARKTDINLEIGTNGKAIIEGAFDLTEKPLAVEIGELANFMVTGLGMDLNINTPAQSALYASAELHFEGDKDKVVHFGNHANLKENPGLKLSAAGIEWNTDFSGTDGFKFDYEFFNINLDAIQIASNVEVNNEILPFQATIAGGAGLNIKGTGGDLKLEGFQFSTKGVDNLGRFKSGALTLMDLVSIEIGNFEYLNAKNGETFDLTFNDNRTNNDGEVETDSITVSNVEKYLHFKGADEGSDAISVTIGTGGTDIFSGSIREIMFYQTSGGEREFRVKEVDINVANNFKLFADMEFKQENSGFALRVAGAVQSEGMNLAAAGTISTINNEFRMGVFVASSVNVNIIGIVELTAVGGGVFYNPQDADLNTTLAALSKMDSNFENNPPKAIESDLKFAVLIYAKGAIGGAGDNAAVSVSLLLSINEQFTRIEGRGTLFRQQDQFNVSLELTVYYQRLTIEGEIAVNIIYDSILEGSANLAFFAKGVPQGENANEDLWGITGNIDLEVLPSVGLITVEGDFMAHQGGLLLDLRANAGFDISVISIDSNFELLVWYLPEHTDPLGMYGKFGVNFSILKGLAEFDGMVSGGFFKRSNYSMLYFAGSVYVKVLYVIDGDVDGYVKFQTKSPTLDYGRGSDPELEQMLADVREAAGSAKDKAEDVSANIEEAKRESENALAEDALPTFTEEEIRKAGYNLVAGYKYDNYEQIEAILNRDLELVDSEEVRNELRWIANNIMMGYESTAAGGDYERKRPRHTLDSYKNINEPESYESSRASQMGAVRQQSRLQSEILSGIDNSAVMANMQINAAKIQGIIFQSMLEMTPEVEDNLSQAIAYFEQISSSMQESLDSGELFELQNPVTSFDTTSVDNEGNTIPVPNFTFNDEINEQNNSKLLAIEEAFIEADNRYKNAIIEAKTNISLLDGLITGDTSRLPEEAEELEFLDNLEANNLNSLAKEFQRASANVRKYNTSLVGYYWDINAWANEKINLFYANAGAGAQPFLLMALGTSAPQITSNDLTKGQNIIGAANSRDDVIENLGAKRTGDTIQIGNITNLSSQVRNDVNNQLTENFVRFWYEMPGQGLSELAEVSENKANELVATAEAKIENVENKHIAFTKSVDELYGIKSNMLVSLYGMIEGYNSWRDDFVEDEVVEDAFQSDLAHIQQALEVPSIQTLSGKASIEHAINTAKYGGSTGNYLDYYGVADIEFSASHPLSNLETSLSIENGTLSNVHDVKNYISMGSGINDANFYFLKTERMDFNREITVALRARSIGGVSASRLINLTVPVSRTPNFSSQPVIVTSGDDTTPPTTPQVKIDYTKYRNTYWLASTDAVSFEITSTDKESGIAAIEYKIGTQKGADDVKEWTEAFGSWRDNKSKLNTTIRNLNLDENKNYYFSFRAINGDGLTTETEMSTPFKVDKTKPSAPNFVEYDDHETSRNKLNRIVAQTKSGTLINNRNAVYVFPNWNGNKGINTDKSTPAPFTIGVNTNNTNRLIHKVLVGVSNKENATDEEVFGSNSNSNRISANTKRVTKDLDYGKETYFYIKSVSYAGVESETNVVGPLVRYDLTPPTAPDISIENGINGFTIRFDKFSDDKQTGVLGYQYKIIASDGKTVRDYPTGNNVDIQQPQNIKKALKLSEKITAQQHSLKDGVYRVQVRAINGNGLVSRPSQVSKVIIDASKPSKAKATASYSTVSYNATKTTYNNPTTKIDLNIERVGTSKYAEVDEVSYYLTHTKEWLSTGAKRGLDGPVLETIRLCDIMNSQSSLDPIEGKTRNPKNNSAIEISFNNNIDGFVTLHPCVKAEDINLNSIGYDGGQMDVTQMIDSNFRAQIVVVTKNKLGQISETKIPIDIKNRSEYAAILANYLYEKLNIPKPSTADVTIDSEALEGFTSGASNNFGLGNFGSFVNL